MEICNSYKKEILNWPDINCTARITIEKDHPTMHFEVFEIVVSGDGGNEYERKGATSGMDTTSNLDEAQPLLAGLIKWDGCSHVNFGDEEGYVHLCGGRSWFNFLKATERIWNIAMKELPRDHSANMFDLELFNSPNPKTTNVTRI